MKDDRFPSDEILSGTAWAMSPSTCPVLTIPARHLSADHRITSLRLRPPGGSDAQRADRFRQRAAARAHVRRSGAGRSAGATVAVADRRAGVRPSGGDRVRPIRPRPATGEYRTDPPESPGGTARQAAANGGSDRCWLTCARMRNIPI